MSITIEIDWARRLFVICGDGERVVGFKRYRDAVAVYRELCNEHAW